MKRASLPAAISMMIFCIAAQALAATDDNATAERTDSDMGPDRKIVHVLNRLTFGPRPHDIDNVRAMGLESFIEHQLNPGSVPESEAVQAVDATSETRHESNEDLLRIYRAVQDERNRITAKQALQAAADKPSEKPAEKPGGKTGESPSEKSCDKPSEPPAENHIEKPPLYPMIDYFNRAQKQFILAKLTRDIESPRQLEAIMTEFWFNHFGVKLAALLTKAPSMRVVFLDFGGWDTHVNQGTGVGTLARRFSPLAGGLADLASGLGPLFKDSVIVVMSEFGRAAAQNVNNGTDHGHGNVMWLLGGDIEGGKVYGRWGGLTPDALHEARDLPTTTDFRSVLSRTLSDHMGVSTPGLARVFPGFKSTMDPFVRR